MARGKKPLLENIEIKKIAAEGKSIAYVEDKVLFVPNTVPGDIVDVQVTRKRKSFLEGLVTRMHHPSELRIKPRCAHFGICGGCKWQNLPYEAQLQFKQQEVIDNLERIGKAELQDIRPIIGAARQFEYRNKLEFTFSSQRFLTREEIANGAEIERTPAVGFHVPGLFDKVVDIEHCYLQGSPSNEIRNFIQGPQFAIFKCVETLTTGNQANLSFVASEQRETLSVIFNSKEPWKKMQKANEIIQAINDEIQELQSAARHEVVTWINSRHDSVKAIPAYTQIPENLRHQIEQFFGILTNKAKEERYIGNLKAMKSEVDQAYDNSVKAINAWVEQEAKRNAEKATSSTGEKNNEKPNTPPTRPIKTVVRKDKAMKVDFDKQILETEEDVDRYLAALRKEMLSYIHQDKNIMLN